MISGLQVMVGCGYRLPSSTSILYQLTATPPQVKMNSSPCYLFKIKTELCCLMLSSIQDFVVMPSSVQDFAVSCYLQIKTLPHAASIKSWSVFHKNWSKVKPH
ncbi:hypothetical protein [Parasitella parasitica]|uniref:Uncharacterized protein n=1 Tax=Parasitella parasitica TaxID=35722 RepID=A0A0B7N170_9FUNG|nr:hypothetical protein [Parasitella parasitica]